MDLFTFTSLSKAADSVQLMWIESRLKDRSNSKQRANLGVDVGLDVQEYRRPVQIHDPHRTLFRLTNHDVDVDELRDLDVRVSLELPICFAESNFLVYLSVSYNQIDVEADQRFPMLRIGFSFQTIQIVTVLLLRTWEDS